jgi:hypothetical protein
MIVGRLARSGKRALQPPLSIRKRELGPRRETYFAGWCLYVGQILRVVRSVIRRASRDTRAAIQRG